MPGEVSTVSNVPLVRDDVLASNTDDIVEPMDAGYLHCEVSAASHMSEVQSMPARKICRDDLAKTSTTPGIVDGCKSTVSLNEFLNATVLTRLAPDSRAYRLLTEFLSLSSTGSDSGISAVNISDSIPEKGSAASVSVPLVNGSPNPELLEPAISEYIIQNSNDSDTSVEIPVSTVADFSCFLQPMNDDGANASEKCENKVTSCDANANTGRQNKQVKRYFCLYCDKSYARLKQHLITQHSEASEVAEMVSKHGRDEQKHLLRLRNLGNHKHNCDVLRFNKGKLVVAYTPLEGGVSLENAQHYVPCPYCFGYYEKKQLRRHCQHRCVWRPADEEVHGQKFVGKGSLHLPVPRHVPNHTCQILQTLPASKADDIDLLMEASDMPDEISTVSSLPFVPDNVPASKADDIEVSTVNSMPLVRISVPASKADNIVVPMEAYDRKGEV